MVESEGSVTLGVFIFCKQRVHEFLVVVHSKVQLRRRLRRNNAELLKFVHVQEPICPYKRMNDGRAILVGGQE